MATHTSLPIYKVAYDLIDVVTDFAKNMPRPFQRPIGSEITSDCIRITILIFRANVAHANPGESQEPLHQLFN